MKNNLFIGLLLVFTACSDFLEEYSQDLARVETVADLDELLLGSTYQYAGKISYQSSSTSIDGSPYNIFIHFMSDELEQNAVAESSSTIFYSTADLFGYYTWQRQVGSDTKGTSIGTEDAYWKATYKYINTANMIIDELGRVSTNGSKEAADKIRIEGETYFLCAFYYFNLVNLYADPYTPSKAAATRGVPLKTTSYVEDKEFSCSNVADVYEQIINDLQKAEKCLAQTERKSVYRADLTATYLLMSRVYLYMQDYKNACTYAQLVLDRNNALFDLNTFAGTDNVLTAQSPETIFSMGGHLLAAYLAGSDLYEEENPFFISEDLINAFDNENDLRKTLYIKEGPYGYLFKKVSWGRQHFNETCSVSDNALFRTSEAYLNLAEAAALDNDEGTARRILGLLQAKRYSTAPVISESGNALVQLIREERQRELCLEGHRWFDLRRYAACEKYPWSKTYRHSFTEFKFRGWDKVPVLTRTYELQANDKAYTMAFPTEVLNFQNTLNKNERPEREPIRTINH